MPNESATARRRPGTAVERASRIRVLHLINGLGAGGAENMLVKIVSRIDPKRFESVVVSLTDGGGLRARLESRGVRVWSLGMRRGRPSVRGFVRLLRILRAESPVIVQTWLYHADLMGLVASRFASVPACAWNLRCSSLDADAYSRLSRWVLWSCARLSGFPDLVVVNSEAGMQAHRSIGYRPGKWRVIGNGFDLDRFRPDDAARNRFRASIGVGEELLIGLLARYDPMKDHESFCRAARMFVSERPDTRFVLVGAGVDHENRELTALIERLGLEGRFFLLGERPDVPAILAGLDVLTLSSAFGEGFSNAIGEGMACGLPSVVTDVGDMARVVGDTGRVVPPRQPRAIADAWLELDAMEPEQRRTMGQAARARVANLFGIATVVEEYEGTYAKLAAETVRS